MKRLLLKDQTSQASESTTSVVSSEKTHENKFNQANSQDYQYEIEKKELGITFINETNDLKIFLKQKQEDEKQNNKLARLMKAIESDSQTEALPNSIQNNPKQLTYNRVKSLQNAKKPKKQHSTEKEASLSKQKESKRSKIQQKQQNSRKNNRYFKDNTTPIYNSFKQQKIALDKKLISNQNKIVVNSLQIYFPYQPYQVQTDYMTQVINTLDKKNNAILQSPTGTGKTLCLLASALSWVQNYFNKTKKRVKIIYLSRTHSQLKQVQKQLQKTCYRPTMAIFASRQQLCIKEEFHLLKGREKIEACGRAIKLARKFNKEGNQQKIHTDEEINLKNHSCQYHAQREQVLLLSHNHLTNKLLDIDIMKFEGRRLGFCPYFYPQNIKSTSTLLLMPYNYLLDSYLLPTYKQQIQNNIVIFDEAHNVADAACEGRSVIIQTSILDIAIGELNKLMIGSVSSAMLGIRQRNSKQIQFMLTQLQDYKESISHYLKEMYLKQTDSTIYRRSNTKQQENIIVISKQKTDESLFQLFAGGIADERRVQFRQKKQYYRQQLRNRLLNKMEELVDYGTILIQEMKQTLEGSFFAFERIIIFCNKVQQLIAPLSRQDNSINSKIHDYSSDNELEHYRLSFEKQPVFNSGITVVTIGLKCLVPWLTFNSLMKYNPRSIIMTSGTLKPLQTWDKQLQLKFHNQLLNGHVISHEQMKAKIIVRPNLETVFNFSYDSLSKNKQKMMRSLIDMVVGIAQRVPNGILIVFPSFRFINDFSYELNRSGKGDRLQKAKQIFFQEKGGDIRLDKFKAKAVTSKGAILGAVCRGKISEGIDLPDGMCRAVIVVGIPFPSIKDPFISEKKSHLDAMARRGARGQFIMGDQWYFTGTMRAVNQAIGRVIRHSKDYGMIFFLDSRYRDNKFRNALPKWIQKSLQVVQEVTSELFDEIEQFYSEMKKVYGKYQQMSKQSIEPFQKIETVEIKKKEKLGEVNAFKKLMGNPARKNKKSKEITYKQIIDFL